MRQSPDSLAHTGRQFGGKAGMRRSTTSFHVSLIRRRMDTSTPLGPRKCVLAEVVSVRSGVHG